jgi:hypothetical protein
MASIMSVLKREQGIHLPEKEVSEIDVNEEKGKLPLAVRKLDCNDKSIDSIHNRQGNKHHFCC